MQLDIEQYRMVKEALHERASMLQSAPHLAHPLPIMLPVYTYVHVRFYKHNLLMLLDFFFTHLYLLLSFRWWQIPYYWFGIKMYDLVAGSKTVKSSYYLSKSNALELFPMLKGDKLTGAIVYYDGIGSRTQSPLTIFI